MAAIGRKMKITKGSVSGIVHRNGIKLGKSKKACSLPKNKKLKSGSVDDAVALKTSYSGFGNNEHGIGNLLEQSKAPETKIFAWPIGDPKKADYHTCRNPAIDGKPYCQKHWIKAHEKTPSVKIDNSFLFHRL